MALGNLCVGACDETRRPKLAADVEGRQVGGDVEPAEGGGMDVEVPGEVAYAWEFGAEEG